MVGVGLNESPLDNSSILAGFSLMELKLCVKLVFLVVVSFGINNDQFWIVCQAVVLFPVFAFSSVRHFDCCQVLFVGIWCLFNVVCGVYCAVTVCRTYGVIVDVILCDKSFINMFNGDRVTYGGSQDLFSFENDVLLISSVTVLCVMTTIQLLKEQCFILVFEFGIQFRSVGW